MNQRSRQVESIDEQDSIEGVVNPDRAIERLGGSRELYSNIVGRFLDDTAGNFALLRMAVSAKDPSQMKRSAHSLKGVAAMCGAESVHDALSCIEAADYQNDETTPSEYMCRVEAEMTIAKTVLRPYRNDQSQ